MSSLSLRKKHKLHRFIRELEAIRGRHTELVSVYIPVGYDLNKIIQHLEQEKGTATNIKDSTTRNHVIDSLEKAIRHLRVIGRTPENGLALFSGNASDKESKVDIKVWSVEPPEPMNQRLYRCDQTFVLEPLKAMMEVKEVYGLIVVDRREGNIGLLKGSVVTLLHTSTSAVPGKTRAGGQSAARYGRIREGMAKEFFRRVGDIANKEFLPLKNLKGIIVGGPGPTKETFLEEGQLNQQLKDKIIGMKDLSYTGSFGLHELVDKSQDLLQQEEIMEEKKIINDFFESLAKDSSKVAYGETEVRKALELGAVDKLILVESIDDKLIDELEFKAEEMGSESKIVSVDTREGKQLEELGGIVAILRFAIS